MRVVGRPGVVARAYALRVRRNARWAAACVGRTSPAYPEKAGVRAARARGGSAQGSARV